MKQYTYSGEKTQQISFPIGGIGSGCIGLAGNGEFIDCEIFNRPNKGSHLSLTHFAVKAEADGEVLDARVLHGDVQPPYMGKMNRPIYNGFGFGPDRESLAGVPHFRNTEFRASYPFATIDFTDEHFPGTATMEAFNPFIPLNEDDSSIPGAFFTISLKNTADRELTYTICFSASNLYSSKPGRHGFEEKDGLSILTLRNDEAENEDEINYGDMAIGTDAKDVHVTRYWYRGNWFDNLSTYWKDFRSFGPIKDRNYEPGVGDGHVAYTARDAASISATLKAAPGETVSARFVLTWNTPNCNNFWEHCSGCDCPPEYQKITWKNYYAKLWKDSRESLIYSLKEFDRLYRETREFHSVLMDTSMPETALEAVSANLAILKSPTCLRLEDGSLYGFEGCHWNQGSCEGTCTHVWSYTYAFAFLFPRLERSMRTLEYTYSMNPDGGMGFRLMLPLGRKPQDFRPCVDGQYGCVMRTWREYKISGDKEWLTGLWPEIKKSIEFAWSAENSDKWDANKDGIMEGRQHHTLDMELFGENAWLSGMYLGGLKAGALIAREVGDEAAADEYEGIFESGKKRLNAEFFNGKYFIQKLDLNDRSLLDPYADGGKSLHNQDIYSAYWNDEKQEIIYQIGEGCGIDQVLGQWHANLIGLGEIFEQDKARSALKSIHENNYMPSVREHFNPCRLYCLNDEAGTLICAWPKDVRQPALPIVYAEETMHGFEYQAAIHMIQEGLEKEGLEVIKAVRDRYDGYKRNPWNEMECGSNYARNMAIYGLVLSYSGFRYDVSKGMIGFEPIGDTDDFRSMWSLDQGWGQVIFKKDSVTVEIKGGKLTLKDLILKKPGMKPVKLIADGSEIAFSTEEGHIIPDAAVEIHDKLLVEYSA